MSSPLRWTIRISPSDDCIIEAAKASLDRRETNYAPGAGVTRLREVYAQYLSDQVGVPYGVENVIVTVGGILTRETLARIAALAKAHDLFVMSDEVYRHILFDGAQYASIASEPGIAERTMIVDSCSKTLAMTGFRIGFGAGPKALIEMMIKLTEGVHSSTPTTGQWAAIEAFKSAMPATRRMVNEYQRRRDYLCEHLNRMKGVRCIRPKGAREMMFHRSPTAARMRKQTCSDSLSAIL